MADLTVVLMTIINIVNKRGKKQKVICENVDCILVKSVSERCTTNRDEHSLELYRSRFGLLGDSHNALSVSS